MSQAQQHKRAPLARYLLSATAALSLLICMVVIISPAYATPASAPLNASVQAGVLSITDVAPGNLSVPADGTGYGYLPSAVWNDATGSGKMAGKEV